MSESRVRLHFLFLNLLCCVSTSSSFNLNFDNSSYVVCGRHQTQALTEFMNEFDSSHCNLSDPFNGIWCDNSTGALTMLRLQTCLSGTLKPNSSLFRLQHLRHLVLDQNNFISSSLPSEFGNLNRLEVLFLGNNSFVGQVPSSFNNLSLLSVLYLSQNELTGSIPLVQNLKKLSFLNLNYNHFYGTLNPNSTSLFELHHLRYLGLAYNNFSSSIPSEIGNLNRLEVLALAFNDFFGQVPPTISNLTLLTQLYLYNNQLTGSLPLVGNLTNLSIAYFSDNHFSGTIPSSLFNMPFLSDLVLSGNDLTGSFIIPNSSAPSRLNYLFLGNNHFEGQIIEPILKLRNLTNVGLSFLNTSSPVDLRLFSALKSLSYLDLSGNSLSPASLDTNLDIPANLEYLQLSDCGMNEFPNILKNLEKLEFIDFSNNRIKGKVPEWLWNLPRLDTVIVSYNLINGFEGPVEEVLVNSSLKILYLDNNYFEGSIPILPLSINMLDVRYNRFTGSVPLSICNCRSLTHLWLPYNNLTGPIPQCLSNLTILNLRKNNFEGSIPDAFYIGASLKTLDVGHNLLTGKLPRSLQNCSSLEFLVVDHNMIEDKFPFWLKALPNLQVLVLSSNKFYGSISPPDQGPLGFPELRIFEIADNKFTGSLPPRYFVHWKASSITMNEDGGYGPGVLLGIAIAHLIATYKPDFFNLNIDYSSYVACGPHQTQALTEFMNEFDSSQCNLSDPYNGVSCDNLTGAVTMLRLKACLSGTLKPNSSLFRLHHLRYLALTQNNFISATIPSEFGNLSRLEALSLMNNSFVGQVPSSFNSLSFLSVLELTLNELTGSFPLVRNLTKLSALSLAANHFYGTLNPKSTSLFELRHLRYLDLSQNNFTSSLPSEFGNLNRLEILYLSSNDFFGQVPPTISNLTSLEELNLHHNQLTGSFSLVQNLTMLSVIAINHNHFSGTIPSSLFTMPFLSYLDLSDNDLTDSVEVYNSSSTLSRLEYLSLGNNHFEGKIIEPISKLISLKILDLSFLNTSYPIDVSLFSTLKDLVDLDLSGNSISPASLGSNLDIPINLKILLLRGCGIKEFPNILKILEKLENIDLSDNIIKGEVPEWFWKLPRLNTVFLSNNSFNGFQGPVDVLVNSSVKNLFMERNYFEGAVPILPLSIDNFAATSNRFTGSIPLSICNYRSLTHLWLPYNNLTGPIPQCLSNLTVLNLRKNNLEGSILEAFYVGASLQTLDVGHNRLTGKLPRSLQNCSSLEFLAVDHNRIKDKFPFWLKALPNLQVLILSSNKFYGSISPPGQGPLGFPELRIFEIADNKFTGSLPPRYFVNWKASSLMMNEDGGLYMETCFGTIAPPTQQPPEEEEGEEEEVLNWKCVGIGYGSGVLLGLTIAQIIASYKPEWLVKIIGPNKRRNR
ncbi:hypothetical protein Bca52824_045436 [Brassica carinata]|uniref:Disease resistance R13L4/SHOC-2-like LRR domain-containing protein n=1 Tax=Brassica carinata TaxID=52824 RepID=A0A8X7RD60_BRACI|nr:hypothetical protein Bca52824_045436 [Brassica carinata]